MKVLDVGVYRPQRGTSIPHCGGYDTVLRCLIRRRPHTLNEECGGMCVCDDGTGV